MFFFFFFFCALLMSLPSSRPTNSTADNKKFFISILEAKSHAKIGLLTFPNLQFSYPQNDRIICDRSKCMVLSFFAVVVVVALSILFTLCNASVRVSVHAKRAKRQHKLRHPEKWIINAVLYKWDRFTLFRCVSVWNGLYIINLISTHIIVWSLMRYYGSGNCICMYRRTTWKKWRFGFYFITVV